MLDYVYIGIYETMYRWLYYSSITLVCTTNIRDVANIVNSHRISSETKHGCIHLVNQPTKHDLSSVADVNTH